LDIILVYLKMLEQVHYFLNLFFLNMKKNIIRTIIVNVIMQYVDINSLFVPRRGRNSEQKSKEYG